MSNNRNDRRHVRHIEAEERREEWEKLSPEQQVASLDARFGVLMGCKKQRARLTKAIEKAKVK